MERVRLIRPYRLVSDGYKYHGHVDVVNKRPHGYGVMWYPDGSKYIGKFQDGLRHGQGILRGADNSIYNGAWENDNRHGFGTYKAADMSETYRGWYKNNMRDDDRQFEKDDDKYAEAVMYVNGRRFIYQGPFKEDKMHSDTGKYGKYTYPDGTYYYGSWKNNMKNGSGKQLYMQNEEIVEIYEG